MVCKDCGTEKTIKATDVDDAMKQIDASGWRDMPDQKAGQVYRCPSCEAVQVELDRTDPRD
jgi:hypothetical protein